jgi:hypothetical protein
MKLFTLVLTAALVGGSLARPAGAQTARIAHFSHSGGLATLADEAAADNFGTPPAYFAVDSIRLISDTSALEYGKWHGYHAAGKPEVQTQVFSSHRAEGRTSAKAYITQSTQYQPRIKIVGYDTIPKGATPAVGVPTVEKRKTKRRKSAALPATPMPPQHPGVLLGVLLILGLGGAGWLLGERPRPTAEPARA